MSECPGCGALKGHGWWCKLASPEERVVLLERELEWWKARTNEAYNALRRQSELVQLWHGKWAIVKHENNQLRKQLWRLNEARAVARRYLSNWLLCEEALLRRDVSCDAAKAHVQDARRLAVEANPWLEDAE